MAYGDPRGSMDDFGNVGAAGIGERGFSRGNPRDSYGGGDRNSLMGPNDGRLRGMILQMLQSKGLAQGGLPFQFGAPPSQVTPNFMPQITPPGGMPQGQGPQNLNDLYGMYGVGANAPMPQAPTLPPPPPPQQPPPQGIPGGFGGLPFSQTGLRRF